MTEPLLTIGAFARSVDLAPSALRFYDEAGLLQPAVVNVQTGYRYYTPALERRAHTIRQPREIGVPVETMRVVLNGPTDHAAEILQSFAARTAETARRTADAVAQVVSTLRAQGVPQGRIVVSVDGPELATALRRVSGAADGDRESPLGVVLLDFTGSELTVVATDRYWLARWSIPLGEVYLGERRLVVPVGEIDALAEWLSRQRTVTLSATEDDTRVTGEDEEREILTSLDRFPAYRLIVDAQSPTQGRATVDRAMLLTAVAGARPTVLVRVGQDRVTVSAQGATEGTHLKATTSGTPVTVGFSSQLLASALTAVVGTQATLSYGAPDQAIWVTSADQRSFTALVMPSRVEG